MRARRMCESTRQASVSALVGRPSAAQAAAAGGGCGPAAAAGGGRSGGWRLTHGAVEPISGHVGCCWICLDMPSAVERVPAYTLDECL